LLPLILIAAVVIIGGYLHIHGSSPGNVPDVGGAQSYWDSIQHDPRFYTAVGALIVTAAVAYLWKNLKPPARYAVIALVAVGLAYVFSGGKR
jgi:hypothetical protein